MIKPCLLKIFLIFSFFLLLGMGVKAANIAIPDSILVLLDNASGKEKIILLNRIADKYLNKNPEKSLEFIKDAIQTAKDLDEKILGAESIALLGKFYQAQGKYDKAINSYIIANEAYQNCENFEGQANMYNMIGILQYHTGVYDQALESYRQSLKISEKKNLKEISVKALNNIGVVYDELQEYDKAMEYYNKALDINKILKDNKGIAASYNNLGNCYSYTKEYDKAIEYFQKSIELKIITSDTKGQANSFFNIACIYFENENYTNALEFYNMCREIEESNKFKEGLANTYLYIGYTYFKSEKYDKAKEFFNKSLSLADSLELLPAQANSFVALSELYYSMKQFEQAFDYYKQYTSRKQEIMNEEKHKQIMELETKYQVEKKEQEIEFYASEVKRQKLIITLASIGIFLLIVFLINLFIQIRQKKKVNKKLQVYNAEIEAQKKKVELHRDLIEEQKIEITSSIEYAKRIQSAVLPSQELTQKLLNEYFIIYKPKDIVSGDFYWVDEREGILYIAAVDCTGHGVPGAFMSMIGNILLNEIFNQIRLTKPSDILKRLNKFVKISLRQEDGQMENLDGMDIAFCAIDKRKNILSFSGANRNLYLMRNGELSIFDGDRTSIAGITPLSLEFKNHEAPLFAGDALYLFSDGFPDQFGGTKGKKFLNKNLKAKISSIHHLPMEAQKEELLKTLTEWKGEYPQVDDILVMGVRV